MSAHLTKRQKKGLAFRRRFKSTRSPPPDTADASLMEDQVVVENKPGGDEEEDGQDGEGLERVVLEWDPFRRNGIRPSKGKRKEREEDGAPIEAKRKRLKKGKGADDGLVALDTGLDKHGKRKQVEQGRIQEARSQALTAKSGPGHEHKQRFILFVGTFPRSL
jgi:hypothetical protein